MKKNASALDRRRFLKLSGLASATVALPGAIVSKSSRAMAQAAGAPRRVIFWITPHGTVWNRWNMNVPGLSAATSSGDLSNFANASWSPILAPLAAHKRKVTVIEGLCRADAIEYERAHDSQGGSFDLNRHHFGSANLMTCVDPRQRPGAVCIGGGVSIDQVIGQASAGGGRWASRVYGASRDNPYSFIAAGEASALVESPRQAYNDLLGRPRPPAVSTPTGPVTEDRETRLRRARASILDFAAREHDGMSSRLSTSDREKLGRHAQLIRDLETSMDVPSTSGQPPTYTPAACNPSWTEMGHTMDQFARVMTLALSCDMTRTITMVNPDLAPQEIGLPAASDIHQDYAHNSIRDGVAGVASYTDQAAQAMTNYNTFYAQRFAYLLDQLDSVPEGDGTLLDHTAVVWMSELGTGTHALHDAPIVVAGGMGGALRTGRYIRYARENRLNLGWGFSADCGPAQSRLYVTLAQAMGVAGDSFGTQSVRTAAGNTMSCRGALPELAT